MVHNRKMYKCIKSKRSEAEKFEILEIWAKRSVPKI